MSTTLQVHNLRLRAQRHEQLWPLRCLLENALAGMSLPALPPTAVILVRHFHCGRLDPARDHPLVLAARFEQALRASLGAGTCCVDQQEAEQATLVWFSDPLQPYRRLLSLWLQGRVPRAWYWRSLLGVSPPRFDAAGVAWLFEHACTPPLGPRAGGLLVESVLSQDAGARLWPMISPTLARRLLPEPPRPVAPAPAVPVPGLPRRWRQALDEASAVWGETDGRLHWLAWQALCCTYPALGQQTDVVARIPRWLSHWRRQKRQQDMQTLGPGTKDPSMVRAAATKRPASVVIAERQRLAGDPAHIASSSVPQSSPGRGDSLVVMERGHGVAACFSPCSGLALVVPLLQRLGMADLLAAHEAPVMTQFPLYLLLAMGRRFGIAAEDPVTPLFRPLQALPAVEFVPASPALHWRQQSRQMSLMALRHASPPVLIVRAQLAMARYLRRYCHMSLRQLVCRPGRVLITHTHWDVLFELEQSDIRLRRLALDCDPGWVPWLGRVVRFHYGMEEGEYA